MGKKFYCPCCGYKTLSFEPPGTYEICEICFWEDDDIQYHDPNYEGGANEQSFRQYQIEFLKGRVHRKPTEKDERNPNWRPLSTDK